MEADKREEMIGFIDSWAQDPNETKECFLEFKALLENMEHAKLNFVARPGVSYSLRVTHKNQTKRELFAMVDVVDDDPADRWLSVCFYDDLVTDPDDIGDWVPEGLKGDDARCFDLYKGDADTVNYIKARLSEASEAAGTGH